MGQQTQKNRVETVTAGIDPGSLTAWRPESRSGPADVTMPGSLLIRDDLLHRLAERLETLSPAHREVIESHFLGRSTQAEVAGQLGCTHEAAMEHLRTGIESLKQMLIDPSGPTGPKGDALPAGTKSNTDRILGSYIQSLEIGRPLDRAELIAAHSDRASDLARFFASYDVVYLWFLPLMGRARGHGDTETVRETDLHVNTSQALPSTVRIGRYELYDVLGSGGQGVVYKALQRGAVERTVALKTLRAEGLAAERNVATFMDEMRLMTKLDNAGLVSILDSGIEDGRPFLVMPLMVGGSLTSVLKNGGLPDPKVAADWSMAMARAIEYLHDKNLIHRDLKPSNILFDAHGQPRVADFGLVRLVEQAGGAAQASSVVVEGTASYMAPEQASGRLKAVGRRTDVYGLGAILYEVLTGRPPFRSDSFMNTLARVMDDEPEGPRRLRPEIPIELEAICLKCLAKDPADRYDSAAMLADELDRFRHGLPLNETHPPGYISRLTRWTRSEPGLATRLFVVGGCMAVIGVNWLVAAAGKFPARTTGWSIGPLSGGPDSLRWVNLATLLAWGLASVGFQAALRRTSRVGALIRAWLGTDLAVVTLLLIIDGGPMTPLTAVYAVLITASGLWSRVKVVAFTTALAMIGYLVVLTEAWSTGKPIGFRAAHIDFLVGLLLLGMITAYQVRRVRALGRLIDEGPES
jgi:eukaryotic-like serine/threonine-protein kinase